MMKKILLASGLMALITGAFTSCSTDVDIAGDYKETTVVYGLLNQFDTVQYIRIQKGFLVNDNVLDFAKVPDSIYYKPEDLQVVLEKVNPSTNQIIQTIPCSPVQLPKDTGIFAGGNQIIYRTNEALDSSRIYRLRITNLVTGKVSTGSTPLIYGLRIKTPGFGTVNWNSTSGNGYDVRWAPATNGNLYQLQITFYWTDRNVVTGVNTPDSLVWTFASVERTGSADAVYNIPNNAFYTFVQEQLEPKENTQRVIGNLKFSFYVGSPEMNQYISINRPSTGLIQEKPMYTNMENALGLFSARTRYEKANVFMSEVSMDTLAGGHITGNLGFVKP